MDVNKLKKDRVYVTIVNERGDEVFSKSYTVGAFYDGVHEWDSDKWLKKVKAYEATQIYTESDASIGRRGVVRYSEDGAVIGMKMNEGSGKPIFADGVFK